MKTHTSKILAIAALLAASNAIADGFYAGVGVTQNNTSAETSGPPPNAKFDSKGSVNAHVFGGYKFEFSNHLGLGLEGRYVTSYGKLGDYSNAGGTSSGELKNAALELSILPSYQITKDLEMFARLGITRLKADITYNGSAAGNKTLDANIYGIGVNYRVAKQMLIRAEYQEMSINDWDLGGGGKAKFKSNGFGISGIYEF